MADPRTMDELMAWADRTIVRFGEAANEAEGISRGDLLSQYAKWLNAQGIASERPNGWPSLSALDETNVERFASVLRERAAGFASPT